MLEIQKFLRADPGNLQFLGEAPYSLSIKQHPKWPELYQFTYDQIESKKDDPIVREARGLILNKDDNWSIVALPFRRFFNEGEGCADAIDWSTARVQEKVDGTLIIMYAYGTEWQVATKGSPDAGGQVGDLKDIKGEPYTFERLFWNSAEYWLKGLSKSGEFDQDYTYLWELTSPYNRVVCDYSEEGPIGWVIDGHGNKLWEDEIVDQTGYGQDGSRITLIGVRNNKTLEEYTLDRWRGDAHYVVKEFPLQSLDQVLEAAKALNPLRQEGFVIVDGNFNRIKVKSPSYVAIHHLRDGSPQRRIMELIKNNEGDEVLAYKLLDEFPHEKRMYEEFCAKLEKIYLHVHDEYDTLKDIETQKDFALKAVKSPYSSCLFALRKGQVKSAKEFFLEKPVDKILEFVSKVTL